ncbi:CGNR zinc finger domain-containing protein [Bacillus horti]|uniref:RNA-binding Zn ribbon-like protein n=1 Tax=Caldalkalibacillus horti TaxID=77523 RepID=A0ABT9VZK9_9BACI|nr:CGNR zinc finger domain-containing protein [Bacillus horti]MDQ0166432.1 putative RNA-binding Zn ribbon-like protein [Bacillus horti]
MKNEYSELELIADFINTYDKRRRFEGDTGIDHLQKPDQLYSWLVGQQLISKQDMISEEDLELALKLRVGAREAIMNHDSCNDIEVCKEALLNELAQSFHFYLVFEKGYAFHKSTETGGKKGVASLLAVIFEIKRNGLWSRLRVCSAEDCQWVFVDRSRPGTGKWCSMKACGNRAKNKTFRQKHKPLESNS